MTARSSPKRVGVGDVAPDVTLKDGTGKSVSLRDFRGKKVVLFFYPKDDSRGCTAHACTVRDAYKDFVAAGAEVIGISSDSVASHESFTKKHALPYRLLSDEGGNARALFGVPKTLGLFPGRATYVIDQKGVVRHLFVSQGNFGKHVAEALTVLHSLAGAASERESP